MILKANHEELEDVTKTMDTGVDTCKTELDVIEEAINELSEVWKGDAADIFYANSLSYMHRLKGIPESLDTMSKFVNKSNGIYKKTDEEYGKKLETEALNDDERDKRV